MNNKNLLIIKHLLTHKEALNIHQISQNINMDYKNTYTIVKRLQKKGLLLLKTFGKAHQVLLQPTPHPLIYEAEYVRKQDSLKNKNLHVLLNFFLRGLQNKFYILLLFGSYAKGKQTKHSDIDLMFIVPDTDAEDFEKNISNITALIPLKLHTHIFPQKEFLAMKNSKELTVGSEAIKNNIILHGIELYYELII